MVILRHFGKIALCASLCGVGLNAHAVNGIYLWGEGGWGEQAELPSAGQVMAQSVQQNFPLGLRASVGYNHDFFSGFGVGLEVGTGIYGESIYQFAKQADVHITTHTIDFLSALNFHFRQWDFYSKIGGVRVTPDISGPTSAESHTIVNPEFILGTAYHFAGPAYFSHFALSLDYLTIIKNPHDDSDIQDPNGIWTASTTVNALLLGIRYNF